MTLLVGDIGGTHARFALAEIDAGGTPLIHDERKFVCADFGSVEDAMSRYLGENSQAARCRRASLAVAGPVTDQGVEFTNSGWRISSTHICSELDFERALLINDLEAVVRAWPHLAESDIEDLFASDARVACGNTSLVIGIGTGFGMSVIPNGDPTEVISTEAGHSSFAPSNPWEYEILQTYWKRFGRVSLERLVSGSGLADLYQTIAEIEGRRVSPSSASEIAERATKGWDRVAKLSVRMLCELLGSVAGDCALVTGARAGVYLRGALVEAIAPILKGGKFRERFEDKGRMRPYLRAVPTYLIVHPEPALLGAAAYASA
ncbi:MAG: glucokinase [Gammaproteobacteria bacterium]|nr:glucokinase [Gammaproteobacteria bacterium]MCY4278389.1 glucokinase [Gammaproteobacteria bacterium]